MKDYAQPILSAVPHDCPEYAEARRLLRFLGYFQSINQREIPPTSLLREFLGGSSFKYWRHEGQIENENDHFWKWSFSIISGDINSIGNQQGLSFHTSTPSPFAVSRSIAECSCKEYRGSAIGRGGQISDEMLFSTPPSLRATSPIFCLTTKHRGGV